MYSKNVAYANGSQDLMGTIETGKFADMVVIDRDIFHIPENDIKDIPGAEHLHGRHREISPRLICAAQQTKGLRHEITFF